MVSHSSQLISFSLHYAVNVRSVRSISFLHSLISDILPAVYIIIQVRSGGSPTLSHTHITQVRNLFYLIIEHRTSQETKLPKFRFYVDIYSLMILFGATDDCGKKYKMNAL